MIVIFIAGPVMATQKPPLERAIKRQQQRDEYIQFETIIDAMGITPGMTILDIGAGPGYASFLFAEKLNGSGEVYATDIREDFVNHIADEAKRKGLTNLFPVLVVEEGVDDFYGKHRYDLVFVSNVYHALGKPIEYFSRLRGSLKPGARLVLVLNNQVPAFSADDLFNIDALAHSLSQGVEDDPFVQHLSPTTKQLLKGKADKEGLKEALVDDFNRILVDPRFYKGFYSDSYFRKGFFTPPEREFANWLLMTLKEDGVLERPVEQIDAKAMRAVIKLNRLFFIKRFGNFLAAGGLGAYVAAGDANRHTSKYVALRELDAAGYEPVNELKLSPYFDVVVMVPKAARADKVAVNLPRTGQNACYSADGVVIPCDNTGQDGDRRAGTAWLSPRFTDNKNGTATDGLTGLIWLKDANCTDTVGGIDRSGGFLDWSSSLIWSNNLAGGYCGLSDNSVAGDWRLPNIVELRSLIDFSSHDPALPHGHPFFNVRLAWYWSSTTNPIFPVGAYDVGMGRGSTHVRAKFPIPFGASHVGNKANAILGVWPVRGGRQANAP